MAMTPEQREAVKEFISKLPEGVEVDEVERFEEAKQVYMTRFGMDEITATNQAEEFIMHSFVATRSFFERLLEKDDLEQKGTP